MSAGTRRGGFSLVELLVAMTLGLLLVGGASTIFRANVRSSELGQAIAHLQANARFALDEISRNVRAAGYGGCASSDTTAFMVSTLGAPLSTSDPRETALAAARVGETDWLDRLPGYVPPVGRGVPVPGTDVLLVQYAEAPGELLLESLDTASDGLQIAGVGSGLQENDLALIADCTGADLLRVSQRTGGSAGGVVLQPDATLSRTYEIGLHPLGVRVLPFSSAIYYIGDTGRRTRGGEIIRSLYLQTFPYSQDTNPALELAEGVDQMRLSFGVRDASGGVRFVREGDANYAADGVASVTVGLLMTSHEPLDDAAVPREFVLAGQQVLAAGAAANGDSAFYPDDRRLRVPFERSVMIRNRGL